MAIQTVAHAFPHPPPRLIDFLLLRGKLILCRALLWKEGMLPHAESRDRTVLILSIFLLRKEKL